MTITLSKFTATHPQRGEIQVLLDMLKDAGWKVLCAHDGEERIVGDDLATVLSVDQSELRVGKGGYESTLCIMLGEGAFMSIYDYTYQDGDEKKALKEELDALLTAYSDLGEQQSFDDFMDRESGMANYAIVVASGDQPTINTLYTADDIRDRYRHSDKDEQRTLEKFLKHGACGSHMVMPGEIIIKRSVHANVYI